MTNPDTPPVARLARSMSEDQLLRAITEAATLYGWRWTHHRRSDRAVTMGHRGWPDLALIRGNRALFLELKAHGKYPTPEQRKWITELDQVPGVIADVVYPKDLDKVLKWLA